MHAAVVSVGDLEAWVHALLPALGSALDLGRAAPTERAPTDDPTADAAGAATGGLPDHLDVVAVDDRRPADALALVRSAEVLVMVVGAGTDPGHAEQFDGARQLYEAACSSTHLTVVVLVVGAPGGDVAEWLSGLADEHLAFTVPAGTAPADGALGLAESVRRVAVTRRRCLGLTAAASLTGPPQRRPRPATELQALARLDRVNADDQWNEAVQAWGAGLWDAMAQHLWQLLGVRPLDVEARLWLARLLAASQRRGAVGQALALAQGAARLVEEAAGAGPEDVQGPDGGAEDTAATAEDVAATRPSSGRWAAEAWLWVARFARSLEPAAAASAASRAAGLAPDRAEPRVELAVQALLELDRHAAPAGDGDPDAEPDGDPDADAERYRQLRPGLTLDRAAGPALAAFQRDPWSLVALSDEPALVAASAEVAGLVDRVARVAAGRLVALARVAGSPSPEPAPGELARRPLPDLAREGRRLAEESRRSLVAEAAALSEQALGTDAVGDAAGTPVAAGGSPPGTTGGAGATRRGGPGWRGGAAGSGDAERIDPVDRVVPPSEHTVVSRGGAGAIALVLCGAGASWVFDSVVWMLPALVLAALTLVLTMRAAAETEVIAAGTETAGATEAAAAGTEVTGATAGAQRSAAAREAGTTGAAQAPAQPSPAAGGVSPPLESRAETFRRRAEAYEEAVADWPAWAGTVPIGEAGVGDLVAFSAGTAPSDVAIDPASLPPYLRAGDEPVPRELRLYRVIGRDHAVRFAARWATFFPWSPVT